MTEHPRIVGCVLFGLLGAAFWEAHLGWHGFSVDHKLNPVLMATLAVNIYIAYYLQFYFASRATDSRSEKNILIDGLRDVLASTRQCRDTLMACYDDGKINAANAKVMKAQLRKISNDSKTIETAITMSQCATLAESCKDIQAAIFNFKSAATGGNFPTKPYDAVALSYQEQTYQKLNQKLHELVFKINRHR